MCISRTHGRPSFDFVLSMDPKSVSLRICTILHESVADLSFRWRQAYVRYSVFLVTCASSTKNYSGYFGSNNCFADGNSYLWVVSILCQVFHRLLSDRSSSKASKSKNCLQRWAVTGTIVPSEKDEV